MALNGQEIYDKYRRNMGTATESIKVGIENTTKDQAVNAIAAKDRMKENLNKALDAGKYEAGLKKSGHAKWKHMMLQKGVPKITAGIDANKTEIVSTFEKVATVGAEVRRETENMPKGGIDNSLNRVRKSMEIQQNRWKA